MIIVCEGSENNNKLQEHFNYFNLYKLQRTLQLMGMKMQLLSMKTSIIPTLLEELPHKLGCIDGETVL
jgi:hypothetical protein